MENPYKDKKSEITLINLIGYKNSYKYAEKLKKKILLKLKKRGKNAQYLKETINFIFERNF